MSDIYMVPSHADEYKIIENKIEESHPHLREAKIILLMTEKSKVKGDLVVVATASKASPSEKAIHGYDFKILIRKSVWVRLDQLRKQAVLDHELTHCSVQYKPLKQQNEETGKMEIVKDEYGRKQYTSEISRDNDGNPKWVIKSHDLEEFRSIVQKYGIYDDSIQSFKEVLNEMSQ